MWLDNASQQAVHGFWQRCGEVEAFPRRLERATVLALPVCIVKLSHLKLSVIENWLARRGAGFQFNCPSRAVRGCLIAHGGEGVIFIDGADPEDEQRFTLAHELAHFISDYWLARESALAKFGSSIAAVFDGLRRPNVTERLHAVLTGTPLGVYTNLLERDQGSERFNSAVWQIEDRADKIALALLAPPEAVLALADTTASPFAARQATITALLQQHFGLPASIADAYGRALLDYAGCGPSWVETLRLK